MFVQILNLSRNICMNKYTGELEVVHGLMDTITRTEREKLVSFAKKRVLNFSEAYQNKNHMIPKPVQLCYGFIHMRQELLSHRLSNLFSEQKSTSDFVKIFISNSSSFRFIMPPISARGYQFNKRSHFVRNLLVKCPKKN